MWWLTRNGGQPLDQPTNDGCAFGALLNFVGRWQPPPREDYPPVRWGKEDVERFPDWCSKQRWFTEQVPWGKKLAPPDLFAAMVATRRRRLGVG